MTGTIFTILGLIIGLAIAIAGGVNLKRDWRDKESRTIYGVFLGIGIVITIGVIIKMIITGF